MRVLFSLAAALVVPFLLADAPRAQVTGAIGTALPVGDFGRERPSTDDGFATPGFAALLYLDAPFAEEGTVGFAFTGTAGVLIFPSDSENYSPFPVAEQESDRTSELGSWTALPVLVGLRYETRSQRDIALIGALQGGVGVVRMPGVEYVSPNREEGPYRLDRDAGMVATLAGSAGLAVAIFDRLELGAQVILFQPPSFTVDETVVQGGAEAVTEEVTLERSIGAVAFTLGYRF